MKKALNIIIIILIIVSIVLSGLFILDDKGIIELPFLVQKENQDAFMKTFDGNYTPNKNNTENDIVDRKNRYYKKYVFVGDSRFVGISKYSTSEKDVFIAKIGEGYSYLIQQMSNIKYQCDQDTALIIGLGVNDANANCDKYIETINEMSTTMDCQIYFVSVNPVEEAKALACGYHVSAEAVDSFNEAIRSQLYDNVIYIDTNTYLQENGYETQDGLHYAEYVSENLYNYIKAFVGPDED